MGSERQEYLYNAIKPQEWTRDMARQRQALRDETWTAQDAGQFKEGLLARTNKLHWTDVWSYRYWDASRMRSGPTHV